jgi:putative transposase
MSLKIEFAEQASRRVANISALCSEFSILRETGYKWLKRYKKAGPKGLSELSR